MISPLLGDQFLYASLLEKLGLGTQAGEMKTITVARPVWLVRVGRRLFFEMCELRAGLFLLKG